MTDSSELISIRRALLSVSDKSGLVDLARALDRRGVELVSTGGTAAILAEAGLEVTRVEDLTGVAEMMGGRLKTLHPAIHGAVLARRDLDEDRRAMAEHDITPIDLVCVNLYPFEQTIGRTGTTLTEAIEQIDIGGPAMLRSAAKNHSFVAVVTSPDQYPQLLAELDANDGATTLVFRRNLAMLAFGLTAGYDGRISAWMNSLDPEAPEAPATYRELRYGENPHQGARLGFFPRIPGPSIPAARVLHGKALSYNNILDAAAGLALVQDLHHLGPDLSCAAIIKHTNACGAATAPDLADAFDRTYEGDPLAAYGGILAVNRTMDAATAGRICHGERFLEVIVAPGYEDAALSMLTERWKNVRLLAVGEMGEAPANAIAADTDMDTRSIPGGTLIQDRDTTIEHPDDWTHAAGPAPSGDMLDDAAFAWTVVKHLKSNAVALAAGRRLLGGGGGLVDRVSACRLAIDKARGKLGDQATTVAASDAFFPFPDGPQLLIEAGIGCIVHPGGSRRDQLTNDLCDKHGVTCLVTGVRHFRH